MTDEVARAAEVLRGAAPDAFPPAPVAYLVLGSGLSHVAERVERAAVVPFSQVPGFPAAGVLGHAGQFRIGWLAGRAVLVQAGRFHLYEGHPVDTVVAPVRVARALGAGIGIFTNAAGGIDRRLQPGHLMLIDDHINLTGHSPLLGAVRPGETRFPDMSAPYDRDLQRLAERAASARGERLQRGVYLGLLGPSFETPAEIRMAAGLGAHAVGMSTVAEVITARAAGMRCLGFSMITNAAAGLSGQPLQHDEVLEVGKAAGQRLGELIEDVLAGLS
ncbi:MAG: purine-nucleoside phosphorylase [Gemmatimonadota bacterium]